MGIVISVLFATAFWFLDSFVDSIITPAYTFMEEAFSPTPREIWIRSFIFMMAILFSIAFVRIYTRSNRENRKLLDEAMERENKYRDLFENAGDAIFVLDTSFNYLDVNRAAEEMLGFTREELLEMNIFDLIPPEQTTASLKELDELDHSGGYRNFVGKLRTKDCMWLDVEVSSTAIVEDGRVVGSRDIVRDITERRIIMDALQKSLKEKDLLLKEIHHRAKNNLTIIQGLLQLQSNEVQDTRSRDALKDSQDRIASVSLIHSMLAYSEDLKKMDMAKYITSLAQRLLKSYRQENRDMELNIDVDDVYLDIEFMMPCGLILSELLTNAIKYAFPSETRGRLDVFFKQHEDGEFFFGVRDNGVGLPKGMKLEELTSLGMKIVITLTEQLCGRLAVNDGDGTEISVTFRKQVPMETP